MIDDDENRLMGQAARAILRSAAFAFGLGIALPSWAQVTPTAEMANPQVVEFPAHAIGGAVRLYDLSGNIIGGTAHPLLVACPDGTANCFSGGTFGGPSDTDQGPFTAGSSAFAGVGGFYQTTATSNPLTTGQFGEFQVTATRALFINLRNAAGTEVGTAAAPLITARGCAEQTVANTTTTPINNAGSATSLKLVSKVAGKKISICAINLIVASANNVALVEGTKVTTECDTSTAGLSGGATAATGWNFATNAGPLTYGNGQGVLFTTPDANFDVCLLFSAANQVSGNIVWAQF